MKRIFLLLLAGGLALTAQAQYGTMTLNPDARSMAMGGVTATTVSSSQTIFNNPSLVSFEKAPVQIGTSYYGTEGGNYYAVSGYYQFLTGGAIQAGWRHYDYATGRDMSIEVGFSHPIARIFSIGIAGRYINYRDNDDHTANALMADVSASCRVPLGGSALLVGAKLANLGGFLSGMESAELPIDFTLGVAFDLKLHESHALTLAADVERTFNPTALKGSQLALGLEYELMQLLQIRGGYHFGQGGSIYPDYASVGAGLSILFFRVDLSYIFAEKSSPLRNAYSLSVGLHF